MENIARLMMELPKDYENDCIEQGAIVRKRGVSSPADLMMLSLFHLHNGCSLLEISEIARITRLGTMSDVAFMKRFEKCGNWFKVINEKMMTNQVIDYPKPKWMEGKTVVAVDASDVAEKGRSGRIYRLHYALDIFKMSSIAHKITTNKTGESLVNFTFNPEQLVIADRAYCTIKSIEHCNRYKSKYILRIRKNSFTLRDAQDEKINLVEMLANLKHEEFLDLSAFATNAEGDKVEIRVCATRKSDEAIAKTQKKLRRQESRKQHDISDETKAFNEYIIVVSNLDNSILATEILGAYRLRWQVEIYFKRLKSILNFGELPKRRNESIVAWLNGKMMIALLIEIVIAKASFSPKKLNQ